MTHEYTLKDGTTLKAHIYEGSLDNPAQKNFAVLLDAGGFSLGQKRIVSTLTGARYFTLDTGERVYVDMYNYIPFLKLSEAEYLDAVKVAESIIKIGERNCLFSNAGFRTSRPDEFKLWEIDRASCNIKDCNKIVLKPYNESGSEHSQSFDMSDFAHLISEGIINPVLKM